MKLSKPTSHAIRGGMDSRLLYSADLMNAGCSNREAMAELIESVRNGLSKPINELRGVQHV